MPAVNIHVAKEEIEDLDILFELSRSLFPGQEIIELTVSGYHADLDGHRSKYILDMLRIATDCRGFEPFVDWQARHRDQLPLDLASGVG